MSAAPWEECIGNSAFPLLDSREYGGDEGTKKRGHDTMARIIADDLLVCGDCLQAIANDDYTGLDYHYSPEEAKQREAEIRAGIESLGGYAVVGEAAGFHWRGCDCCGSDLGGDKWECSVLGS